MSDFNSKLPDELGNIQIDESSFLNPNGSTDSFVQDACSSSSTAPLNDHLSQLLSAAGVPAAASSSPAATAGSRFTSAGSATSVVGNLQSLPMQIHVSMGKMQMPLGLAAINKNSTAPTTSGVAGANVAASNSIGNMIAAVPRLNAMTLVRTNRPALISQSHGLGVIGPTGSIITTTGSVMASTASISNAITWPVSVNMTNVNLAPNSMIIAVDQNPQLVALQRGGIPRFPQKIVRVSAPVGSGPISQLNFMPTVSTATSVGVTPPGGSLTQQTMMTLRVSYLPLWYLVPVFCV